jgi:hypothetical protein
MTTSIVLEIVLVTPEVSVWSSPLRSRTASQFPPATTASTGSAQVSNFITWTQPSGRLQLELDAENDFGRLPFGNFIQRLLQSKVIYAFSPSLILSSFAQYDTESRQVGVNNRVRWTMRPNADLFVVWNRGWKHALNEDDRFLEPLSDQFVLKFRWIGRW